MKKLALGLLLIACTLQTVCQQAYQTIDKNGRQVSWDSIVAIAADRPYIFFGELHDQKQSHLGELQFLTKLQEVYPRRVVLAMEMFERDVQPLIDEYFGGQISQNSFQTEARVWKNYAEDYKPLVEFARQNNIPLIASNVPRRYASSVYHQGISLLDSLSDYAKQFLPALPLQVDTSITIYKEMQQMLEGHQSINLVHSQALKDATMAQSLIRYKTHNNIILHINGAYHSKNWQGIPSFLPVEAKEQLLTINTVLDSQPYDITLADYTLIINDGNPQNVDQQPQETGTAKDSN